MKSPARHKTDSQFNQRLAEGGLRLTPQREHVYRVLLDKRDHPTAETVFLRAKQTRPDISMATVYNCLDALVRCGLVKAVHHHRGATQYCPNMREHSHFYCESCGSVFDIDFVPQPAKAEIPTPKGFKVTTYELTLRGLCSDCAAERGEVRPR
jgi:Fur family peroxide stress response transcriptional regulator